MLIIGGIVGAALIADRIGSSSDPTYTLTGCHQTTAGYVVVTPIPSPTMPDYNMRVWTGDPAGACKLCAPTPPLGTRTCPPWD
jgi:hypothetical protein